MLVVRDATDADLKAIVEITNEAILSDTANWNTVAVTMPQRLAWMEHRRANGLPVLVADDAGVVAGYGSFGPFRAFDGYVHTVEHGLYIHRDHRGQGHGAAILGGLIERAGALDLHVMVGAIDATNAASVALHRRFGFAQVGLMPQVGRKFGRWLDLLLMQKMLKSGSDPDARSPGVG